MRRLDRRARYTAILVVGAGVAAALLTATPAMAASTYAVASTDDGVSGVVDAQAVSIVVCQDGCDYTTIAAGIAAAAEGDIIEVAAGTYAGGIALNKPVTLRGAGNGGDPSVDTIIEGSSGNGITTSNGSAESRVTIENLRVTGFGSGVVAGSHTTLDRVVSTANSSYGINLSGSDNAGLRITGSTISFNATGVKLGSAASARDIEIADSHFDDNTMNGWYADKSTSGDSQLDDVTMTRATFDRNGEKGFYAEKLSNATFTDVTANGSGHDRATMGNGISINLKAGDYSDIVFDNLTALNSGGGQGAPLGAAVDIQARNDGSYAANPATLTGLVLDGGEIGGSDIGLIIGGGTTGAVVTGMNLSGTVIALHNENGGRITATHNFWGSANPDFSTIVSGDVNYSPWWKSAEMSAQPTSVSLALSSPTMPRGDANTRAVASVAPAVRGAVQFFDGGAPLGGPVVVDGGAASIALGALGAGSHSITAQFTPDDTMDYLESPVSDARTIVVNVPNAEPAPAPATNSDQLQEQIQSGAVPTIPPSSFNASDGSAAGNTDLQSLDPSKPLQGEIPWSDGSDSYVDVYAYSTPVFLGTFPVVNGQVQLNLTPAQLQLLAGGDHDLVFIGQTSGTTMAVAIQLAVDGGGVTAPSASPQVLANTGASTPVHLSASAIVMLLLGAVALGVARVKRKKLHPVSDDR